MLHLTETWGREPKGAWRARLPVNGEEGTTGNFAGFAIETVCRGVGDGWSLVARQGAHGVSLLLAGGSLGCGGEPLAAMNWGYVHGPDGAAETVRRFVELLHERALPGVITVAGEVRDEGDKAAEAAGLEREARASPLMAVELNAEPVETGRFEVTRVTDAKGLAAAALILEDAYDISLEYMDNLIGRAVLGSPAVTWFVGRDGGQPASACAVSLAGTIAGVYAVGTAHAHRRKGAARATIATAMLDCAARGARVAGLLSDTAALPLYVDLGFLVIDEPSEWRVPAREAV
jgi:GNAT superfamily N-acetyltransferase